MVSGDTNQELLAGLKRAALAGAFWTTLDRWGSRILRLAVLAVLARLLDPRDFGLVAAAAVCVDYLSTYVGQGLGLAVIQRERLETGHLNAMFCLNLAFALLMTAAAWLAAPTIAQWLEVPEASRVLRWLSWGLVLEALSRVQVAWLLRNLRYRALAVVNLCSAGLGGLVGIILAIQGYGVWALVAQQLTRGAMAWLLLTVVSEWRPDFQLSRRHIQDLYGFSIFVFAEQQLVFVARRLDEALIAGYLGVVELGYYSMAKRLVLILQDLLEAPLSQVLIPTFSRMQSSVATMIEYGWQVFRTAALVGVPAFFGLMALAPQVLSVAFGEQWAAAATPARWLAFGGVWFLVSLTIYPILLATGRPGVLLALNGSAAALGVGLLAAGLPYGANGVAAALALRQTLMALLGLVVVNRLFSTGQGFREFFRAARGPLALGLVSSVVAWGIGHLLGALPVWLSLGFAVAAGLIVVAGGVSWVDPQLAAQGWAYFRQRRDRWLRLRPAVPSSRREIP